MKRIRLSRNLFVFFAAASVCAFNGACVSDNAENADAPKTSQSAAATPDSLSYPAKGSVKLSGVLGKSLDASMKGDMLSWDVNDLVRPFKTRPENKMWQIEFWGKWFTSAALAYDYEPSAQLDKILKYAASELLKTQGADGSITTYKKDSEFAGWDMWGRKYVLLGLLAEYVRTGDSKILNAAEKHADSIMASVGEGKKSTISAKSECGKVLRLRAFSNQWCFFTNIAARKNTSNTPNG